MQQHPVLLMGFSEALSLLNLKFVDFFFIHSECRFPRRHHLLQDLLVGDTISCKMSKVIVTLSDAAPEFVTSAIEKFDFAFKFVDADFVNNVPLLFGQTVSGIVPEFARNVYRSF